MEFLTVSASFTGYPVKPAYFGGIRIPPSTRMTSAFM
jgi:hypothetical protein